MRQLLLKVEARDVFKTYGNIGCGDCKKGDTKLEIFVTPSKQFKNFYLTLLINIIEKLEDFCGLIHNILQLKILESRNRLQ